MAKSFRRHSIKQSVDCSGSCGSHFRRWEEDAIRHPRDRTEFPFLGGVFKDLDDFGVTVTWEEP